MSSTNMQDFLQQLDEEIANNDNAAVPKLYDQSTVAGRSLDFYEKGNLLDFFGQAAAGFVEAETFTLARFGERDFNKMNLAERMGRGLGTGIAYMNPFSPFALLGKGGNAVVKHAASNSTKNILKKIQKNPSLLKHIDNGTDKAIVEKAIKEDLFTNPIVLKTLNRYGITDKGMLQVENMLINNVDAALRTGFKNSGKEVNKRLTRRVAEDIATELRKPGRHINTVEDWVEKGLTQHPWMAKHPFMAKYAGMAAQDVAVFTAHQAITGLVGAGVYGETPTLEEVGFQTGINTLQAALFPGVRYFFTGGGQATLRQGFSILKNRRQLNKALDKFNYKDIASRPEGQKGLRGLLHILTKGSDLNVVNTSRFSGRNWTVKSGPNKGKTYNPNEIIDNADDMPIEDVIDILGQYKKWTADFFPKFSKAYLKDVMQSSPRMFTGSLVMNIDMFWTDRFNSLTYPELIQHMAIGAFMTKNRGLWARDENPGQWAKDFSNYEKTFNYLNMDMDKFIDVLDVYSHNRELGDLIGLTVGQTEVGNTILDLVNPTDTDVANSYLKDGDGDGYESLPYEVVKRTQEAVDLAVAMARTNSSTPEDVSSINVKNLPASRIKEIYDGLSSLKMGESNLAEIPLGDLFSTTMREISEKNKMFYLSMLDQIAQKTGLDIRVETEKDGEGRDVYTGKVIYEPIPLPNNIDLTVDGQYHNTINDLYYLLNTFKDLGIASEIENTIPTQIVESGSGNDKKIIIRNSANKANIADIIDKIASNYTSKIVKNVHGNNSALRIDKLFARNPYLQSIVMGRIAENKEMAYRLANSQGRDLENLTTEEKNFIQVARLFFTVNSEYTTSYGDDANINGKMIKSSPKIVPDNPEKFSKLEGDKLKQATNDLAKQQTKLNSIFEFMSAGNTERVAPEEFKNTITESQAQQLLDIYQNLNFIIPRNAYDNMDFMNGLSQYVMQRSLEGAKFNEETLALVTAAKDMGVFDLADKTILRPDVLREALLNPDFGYSENQVDDAIKKYQVVYDKLIKSKAIKEGVDPPLNEIPITDIDNIQFLYDITFKGNVDKVVDNVTRIRDSIDIEGKSDILAEDGAALIETINTFTQSALELQSQGVTKNVDILNTFDEAVNKIIDNLKSKITNHPEITSLVEELRITTNTVRDMYKKNQFTELSNSPLINDIGIVIENLVKYESNLATRVRDNLTKMISLSNDPYQSGRFLRTIDNLGKELSLLLKQTDPNTVTLEELINDYQSSRSMYDLNNILEKHNMISMSEVTINKYKIDLDESINDLKQFMKKNAAHNNNDSPMKSLKRFGLTDPQDVNKIDPTFVDIAVESILVYDHEIKKFVEDNFSPEDQREIFKDGGLKLNDIWEKDILNAIYNQKAEKLQLYVEESIANKYKNDPKKVISEIDMFKEKAGDILRYVSSLDEPIETFSIRENSIVVDNVPGRRTLAGINSPLIKELGITVMQVNESIIFNGRKTTINSQNLSKDKIEQMISTYIHTNPKLAEQLFKLDFNDVDSMQELLEIVPDKSKEKLFVLLDMTDGAPIAVPLSPDNVQKINDGFKLWKENKLIQLELNNKDKMNNFNFAVSRIGESSQNIPIKMLLMNLDRSLPKEFDKFFESEIFRDDNNRDRFFTEIESKILKKTKQTVNRNYDYINDGYQEIITRIEGLDPEVKDALNEFHPRTGRKARVLIVKDEDFKKAMDDGDFSQSELISNRGTIVAKLDAIISDPNSHPNKVAFAEKAKKDILNDKMIESLHSSAIDGAVIINNPKLRMALGYLFGDKNANGFKNNIAHAEGFNTESYNSLITKGYFHKNNSFADLTNLENIDLIVGESAAKSFFKEGSEQSQSYVLRPGLSLYDNLKNKLPENNDGVYEIPLSAIGLGHRAKNSDNVLVSNSLNDFMTGSIISELRTYSGLDKKIQQLLDRKFDANKMTEPEYILSLMRELEDETGYDFTEGSYGLVQNLLRVGLRTDDPVAKASVSNLFRGKIFDILRRNMTEKGGDTYLIPDLLNDLDNSMFIEFDNVDKLGPDGRTVVKSRVQTYYGKTKVPYHMGQKQIKSVSDVDFIISHEGRDVRVRFTKGKMEVTDVVYDIVNNKKHVTTLDGQTFDATKIQDNKELMSALKELESFVNSSIKNESIDNTTLTYKGLLDLLNGNYKIAPGKSGESIVESNPKRTQDAINNLVSNFDLGIGIGTIAIPKKSLDFGFNRLEGFLAPEDGNHSMINNYDLRVMHQRDFDGDHGYHYFALPNSFIHESIKKAGTITDYVQAPKLPFKTNIFGMDSEGYFGQLRNEVGFTNLKNQVNRNQFVIGETISLKNSLNWASNIGINLIIDGEKVSFLDGSTIDMINKGLESPEALSEIAKANINQNAVDYNSKTDLTSDLVRATLFGDLHPNIKERLSKAGIDLPGVMSNSQYFKTANNNNPNEALFNQAVVKTILRVLTKPKAVMTDPFNEGGQFTPTDYYIGKIYQDLQSFLTNPNQFIANQLIQQFSGNQAMMQIITQKFFSTRESDYILDNAKLQEFFSNKFPKVQNVVVTLDNAGNLITTKKQNIYDNPSRAINMDTGGYVLENIYKTGLLKDNDFYGDLISNDSEVDLSKIISRKNNLLNNLAIYRALYPESDPIKNLFSEESKDDMFNLPLLDQKGHKNKLSFKNVNTRSAVYHMLNKEASGLKIELNKMEGSQYKINEYEHSILSSRLRDIESAMQILEKLAYQGLVKTSGDANIFYNNTPGYIRYVNNNTVHVYRIKGKIDPNDIINQDFSKVEFIAQVNPKSKNNTYKMQKGFTYVELRKPLIKKYLGDSESVHNFASWSVINDLFNSDNISKTEAGMDIVYTRLSETISRLNDNYSFARNYAKDNLAERNEVYRYSSLKDQAELESFFKEFGALDKDGNFKVGENDPGLDLVFLLLRPRAMSGAYIKGPMSDLPYVYSSPRVQSAVYQFLGDRGLLNPNTIPERLQTYIDLKNLRVDIIRNQANPDEYEQKLTTYYNDSPNNSVKDVLNKDRTTTFIDNLFADYGFFDPGMSNSWLPKNYEGKIYTKSTIKNKKIKFVSSKKRLDGGCK